MAETPARTTDPWVESPWFGEEITERGLTTQMAAIARQYHTDGFAVIPGVVGHDLVMRVVEDMIEPLGESHRVQDAWKFSGAVRELAVMPAVLDVLRTLYGREPVPFQTLNFEYGTQQRAHSDTVHFSSLPRRFMCGVWVALEDIDSRNGPVFYYPGSQRLPDPFFQRFGLEAGLGSYPDYEAAQEALLAAHGLAPVEFHAKAGDILIWSANLVHGGKPILDEGPCDLCVVYAMPGAGFDVIVNGDHLLSLESRWMRSRRLPSGTSGRGRRRLPGPTRCRASGA